MKNIESRTLFNLFKCLIALFFILAMFLVFGNYKNEPSAFVLLGTIISLGTSFLLLIYIVVVVLYKIFRVILSPFDEDEKLPAWDFKPIFDHIRNFGIASAMFPVGYFVAKDHTASLPHLASAAVIVIGATGLLLLNIADGTLKLMRALHRTNGVRVMATLYVLVVCSAGGMALYYYWTSHALVDMPELFFGLPTL